MNKYLDNFNRLFSDDDQIVYQAILEKKDWICCPLYLPGNLDITIDEQGKKHFKFLESLFDNVILFKKSKNELASNFRYVKFLTSIINEEEAMFYIEYDFTRIDEKGYRAVVANYYPCLNEEELHIDYSSKDTKEALKTMMIGENNESVIILDENALINDAFFAPIIRKIFVKESAPKEVKEVLINLAVDKDVEYVELK